MFSSSFFHGSMAMVHPVHFFFTSGRVTAGRHLRGDAGGVTKEAWEEGAPMVRRSETSTHRIHGAAIYGNVDPINIPQSC